MDKSIFFDGQNVLNTDLNNVETTKIAAIKRRGLDIATQTGILTGLGVTNPIAFTLQVAAGVAYDSNGEALVQVGTSNVVVAPGDVGSYLVIRHSETLGTPIAHPITGVLTNTRSVDGTSTLMIASPLATDVVLARLLTLSGGGTATLNVAEFPTGVRKFWSARIAANQITDAMLVQSDGVITHINSFGTGVVSPTNPHGNSLADFGFTPDSTPVTHQLLDHTNGIEKGSAASCLNVVVNAATAPDQLNVTQLTTGDSIVVNGLRRAAPSTVTGSPITFLSASANPELYEIYVDSAGVLNKSARVHYTAPQTITGVQIVDVSPGHQSGTFVLGQIGTTAMIWDGGLDTDQPEDDGFMIVRRPDKPEQYLVLWLDVSALSSGLSDTITINASVEGSNAMVLANVPWSGLATGFLGYGNWASSGVAYDKRQFGSVGPLDLNTKAIELYIERYFRETRGDGIAQLDPASDTTDAFVGGGLTFNISAGIGYANGKRVTWAKQPITVPNTAKTYIWIDQNGVVKQSINQPFIFGFTSSTFGPSTGGSVNTLARGIALAIVTAAGGVLTVVKSVGVWLAHAADARGDIAHTWTFSPGLSGKSTNIFYNSAGQIQASPGPATYEYPLGGIPSGQLWQGMGVSLIGTGASQTCILGLFKNLLIGTTTSVLTMSIVDPPNAWAIYSTFVFGSGSPESTTNFPYYWRVTTLPLTGTAINAFFLYTFDSQYFGPL